MKSVSMVVSAQQRSKQFIWKDFHCSCCADNNFMGDMRYCFSCESQTLSMNVVNDMLSSLPLKTWMEGTPWFSWMFGCLGTFIQLEIILIPQFQFAFLFNYIVLITAVSEMQFLIDVLCQVLVVSKIRLVSGFPHDCSIQLWHVNLFLESP
uniref:Uncharacterized protein n=1 Tax=Trichobilharzia regenti TaxID=157069 RepID=A0AA85K3A0_TRIRE|nr:unnamed protein product [Trichobilharzia regenti]